MSIWVAVHGIVNGEQLAADVLNRPTYELVTRTNYLKSRLDLLEGAGTFEALKLTSVPLAQAADLLGPVPEVGDVVWLDSATGKYAKAKASMALLDEFNVATTANAIGVLEAKAGTTGTVCVEGKLKLETAGAGWDLSALVESGETFRPGPYYLSATEAGKLTAYPQGARICVGNFTPDALSPPVGGYAVLNIQHSDTGTSHVHRSFKLHAKPAGAQVVTEFTPDGVHSVVGYSPDGLDLGLEPVAGDRIPRLVVGGTWTDTVEVEYELVLGTENSAATPPATFDAGTYIHWSSSDPVEGSGKVRIPSFEVPVAVGSRGMTVLLENPDAVALADCADWDQPYLATSDDIGFRTWTVTMPGAGQGWRGRKHRTMFAPAADNDSGFTFLCLGGPMVTSDSRSVDVVSILVPARIYSISLASLPEVGDTTVIGTDTYTYTDGTAVSGVPVQIAGDAEDPIPTYRNLLAAIIEAEAEKDEADRIVPVLDAANSLLLIGAKAAVSITHVGSSATTVSPSACSDGTFSIAADSVDPADEARALVYDSSNDNLAGNSGYWADITAWVPISLSNGTIALPVPFTQAWEYSTDLLVSENSGWTAELVDLAVGAKFEYAIGMHQGLSSYYPPVPAKSASLVLNGVELDSVDMFGASGTYSLGADAVYWYNDSYNAVPWPVDWVSSSSPGSLYNRQKMVLHFTRRAGGATNYVTSIRPAHGSPITVTQCGTTDSANTGDLELGLNLSLATTDSGVSGHMVVKRATNGKLERGPVVERVVPGPGISIAQNPGSPQGQGTVIVGLSGVTSYSGDFEEIALENAKQELIGMFPYVRLLGWRTGASNINTGFVAKFRVPHDVLDQYYKVNVYATVFGETGITTTTSQMYAGLSFTFSILPDVKPIGTLLDSAAWPTQNLLTGLVQPEAAMVVDVPIGNPAATPVYSSYDPVLIHNDPYLVDIAGHQSKVLGMPFPTPAQVPAWAAIAESPATIGVRPGSLIGVKFARANTTQPPSEYTGALGFINLRWKLTPA